MHRSTGKALLRLTFLILLLSALSGCISKKEEPVTIKIAAIYNYDDQNSRGAQNIKKGIEWGVELVNQTYDINLPLARGQGLPLHKNAKIEVVFLDHDGKPELAAELVEKAVKEYHAAAIIGCYESAVTASASERAEMLKVPFINSHSTAPLLNRRGYQWFFSTTPDDNMLVDNFFQFLTEIKASDKLLLVYENGMWGTGVAQAEMRLAQKYGYTIATDIPYKARQTSFTSEVSMIKRNMPAIILQSSYEEDGVALMREYQQVGLKPTAIIDVDGGLLSPYFMTAMQERANGVLSSQLWAADAISANLAAQKMVSLYEQKYGMAMNGQAARSFTGFIVLAEALNRAQDFSPPAIRAALLKTRLSSKDMIVPWDGVRFDPQTGQNILGKGIIVQMQDGKYYTVWPQELASKPLIGPLSGTGVSK